MDMNHYGQEMYQLAKRLFPICRSITGNGVRETLDILSEIVPIRKYEVPTGTAVFDWTVPQEWNIRGGFIEDETSKRILDFAWNNLSIVGYSEPVDQVISKEELLEHVYSEPAQPDAIPYVTSYYKRRYGFCMTENQRKTLGKGPFHVVIDSELKDGSLTYGEIVLPGESEQEIFLSTYICHPSMANDNLSGPCVLIYLAKMLSELPHRRYTYRMIFIPETIGAITYLSRNYIHLKEHVVAGFNISCVGDDRAYSYVASRYGDTLADKAAKNILSFHAPDYKSYGFLQRGSDERQYCAPGIDLPLCAICRSKYGEYPEYHTSLDNLSLISETGLGGALDVYWKCLMGLEHNYYYCVTCLCEPQLGKRGLYPTLSRKGSYHDVQAMTNFIAYADGSNDLFDISNMIRVPTERLIKIADTLQTAGLLERGETKKKPYKAERKDNIGFSIEWENTYQAGAHNSVWPWSEVVSLTSRYFRGDKTGLRVLELGCGAGANIPFFAAINAEYYGIEGSSTQVKRLQEQYMGLSHADKCRGGGGDKKQINVSVGDFTKALPFAGEFDLILDRGSVTHNNTADIRKAIALAYEKLRKGGYYFGLDWFSTNFGIFSDSEEVYDVIDDHTRVFHSGYFEGLGNVHFSDADHIQELFQQMTMIELYEKVSIYTIPKSKRIAHWSFVAQK